MCQADLMVVRGRLRGRLAGAAAAIAIAAGLTACGEDDSAQSAAPAETGVGATESQTTTAADQNAEEAPDEAAEPIDHEAMIVATLEAVLAGDDAKRACEAVVTERFVRRAYGDAAGCAAALASAKPANDAGVRQVVVNPESVAQALARPVGGIYDGQKLRAELVLDDDEWKLDSLRSNVPVGP